VIEFFNAGAERMLGYAAEEVVGRHTPALIHVAAEVEARAAALSAELGREITPGFEVFVARARVLHGRADQGEWTYVRKDGRRLPVLLSVTALRQAADGRITGFLGVAVDQTERQQARESLASMAELLRQTGEMAQVGGWELDLVTLQPIWSAETRRIHEVGPTEEPPLARAIEFYAPEARPVVAAAVQRAMVDGTPWDLELPFTSAKGRDRWVRTQGRAVTRDGRIVKLVGTFQDITERKLAEREREANTSRLEAMLAAIPDLMFEVGLDGRYHACLTVRSELLIVPAEELLGRTVEEMLPAAAAGVVMQSLREAHATGLSHGHQFDLSLPVGRRWFEASVARKRVGEGEAPRFIALVRDITQRTVALQALQATRQRLEKTFAAMSEGVVLHDAQGAIVHCNAAAERILGLTQDQIFGRSSVDPKWRCVREDGSAFPGAEHPAMVTLASGVAQRDVLMGVHKADGSLTWIEINAELIGAVGEPERQVVVSFGDVTGKRLALAALKASADELARQKFALDEHSLVSVSDLAGAITYANDKTCRTSGYRQAELLGKNHRIMNSGEHPKEFFAAMYAAITQGNVWHGEIRNRTKGGACYWIEMTVVPFRGADGKISSYVAIGTDITARRDLASSLAVARDQALTASRLKSEFLATMSHEIRTPMNGVIGMAGLLMESPLSDEQRDMSRVILSSAENLLGIINDILDFSKIEAGKLRIEPEEFELRAMVEETLALLATQAHEKRIELACDFDAALTARMRGDEGRIRQVLTNLVGNAVKFTEAGEVVVRVKALRERADRTAFRVEVQDTGIGIAPDVQSRLFEAFTQADGTTTRRFGGTGLGLAISRQLIELMAGSIGFKSELGRGSTFWFELELPRCAAVAAEAPGLPATARLLVVDDNPTNRRILLDQLGRMGLQVDAVADGPEALRRLSGAAAAGAPYEVALIDWHMPGMDGLALAVAIRSDPILAALPLVMLSSAGPLPDPGAATAVGFAAFLTKPVQTAQVQRCLARVLNSPREIRRAESAEVPKQARALRLLVAEDNPANQLVARMLLNRLGHTVEVAGDGLQALARLAEGRFDAVLMDCQMPRLDGFDATRRIRSGAVPGLNPRIPVIAVTAYAMPGDKQKCISAGMDDYVTKPLRADQLGDVFLRCGLGAAPGLESGAVGTRRAESRADLLDPVMIAQLRTLPGRKGPSLLPELIELFRRDEAARLATLGLLVRNRQGAELAGAAHALAGSFSNLGARSLRMGAHALENAARAGDWADAERQLALMVAAWPRLNEALAELESTTP
jgi:PAS domain S-box-containing protein